VPHAERDGEYGAEATEERHQGRLVLELALEPADMDGGAHAQGCPRSDPFGQEVVTPSLALITHPLPM